MRLYIAGGCSEHGRNSFLITGEPVTFMVDAGKMKEKPDKPFPELTDGQIRSIDYLFLTHCHTDHTGAIGFLEDRGFCGTIVGTSATLRNIPPFRSKLIVLEDYSGPNSEIRIHPELSVLWGRAGHCIGSVWYRFKSAGKTLLFTGDYEEQSIAYTCDAIRDMDADLAVIDCAYGYEAEDAREHWVMLNDLLDSLIGKGKPLLFPVPSHGRGFDIIRMLSDRGITTVLTESLLAELWDSPDREVWLKEDFILAVEKLDRRDIHTFEADYTAALKRGESFPTEYREAGILVRDSQLVKGKNREIARGVSQKGGRTILTGKQDPASFARELLNRHEADFCRISVHQNVDEMMRLRNNNHFRVVVPYHCREKLVFDEPDIAVLEPGDSIEI